jgi:CRISPR-associated protein Csx17
MKGIGWDPPTRVVVHGCAPTPLAHYLKALGLLRTIAEQADPDVRGWWADDRFCLASTLDAEGLLEFLLEAYAPTPLVAPWNGGSGFYPKDNQEALLALERSAAPRFAPYRAAIARARAILGRYGLREKPDEAVKPRVLRAMRNEGADLVVAWVDAAAVLTRAGPRYPPLLGTGGNDGRLEFSNNFMQQLLRLFDPVSGRPLPPARRWLEAALWGDPTGGLARAAVGQFFPGSAGGPNASTGFEGESLANPWDFVLMLEGAVLFAAAAHRRLAPGAREAPTAPFTARMTMVGHGSLAARDTEARAEIWMPLWARPTSLPEVQMVLREGRAHIGRRPAHNGLDFARACAALAVDRGIREFQRYGLVRRAGRSYLATPLGRVPVRRNPVGDLLSDVDGWMRQAEAVAASDKTPAAWVQAIRQVEAAAFAVARRGDARAVQQALVALAEAERVVGASPAGRQALPPIPALNAEWAVRANDGSRAYRLALALASLHHPVAGSFRTHWSPVTTSPSGSVTWLPEAGPMQTWHAGSVPDNLLDLLQRRVLAVRRAAHPVKPTTGWIGAAMADVAAWMALPALDGPVAALARGLSLVAVLREAPTQEPHGPEASWPMPRAYAVLALVCAPEEVLRPALGLPSDARVPLPERLVGLLRAGRVEDAAGVALRRLRSSGIAVPVNRLGVWGVDRTRLAAALVFPVGAPTVRAMAALLGVASPMRPR